ncbi:MAG: hypothetical protein NVS4B12_15770 [Ktedonobacteraceae bacterium]
MQEQQNYGGYTGSPQYDGPSQQQQYSTPPQGQSVPPPLYDDSFMDSFAQRLSQRIAQGPQGKIYPQGSRKDRASAGQRLALAIVSLCLLVPIGGIVTGLASSAGWFVGMAVFGVAALTILLVNIVFNWNG